MTQITHPDTVFASSARDRAPDTIAVFAAGRARPSSGGYGCAPAREVEQHDER